MKNILNFIFLTVFVFLINACGSPIKKQEKKGLDIKISMDTTTDVGDHTELINNPEPNLGGNFIGIVFNVTIKNNRNQADTISSWKFIENPAKFASYEVNYLDSINRFCTKNKLTIYPPMILAANEIRTLKMVHCIEVDEHIVKAISEEFEDTRQLPWNEVVKFVQEYRNKHMQTEANAVDDECFIPFSVSLVTRDSVYVKLTDLMAK
jgi:hypothetical protein